MPIERLRSLVLPGKKKKKKQAAETDGAQPKLLLAVYYQQDVTTEFYESVDGERWVTDHAD